MTTKQIDGIKVSIPPTRVRPHDELVLDVSNQSTRHGVSPDLIVLHSTESPNHPGILDLQGLGAEFNTLASDASAHVGVDGDGNSARYVPDSRKAWSCVFYNARSLNIEQVGFASQHADWPEAQLREVARWIARWSKEHDIPIRAAKVTKDGRVLVSGVIRHEDLGNIGGAHHDPDLDTHTYPLHAVLDLARFYRKHL